MHPDRRALLGTFAVLSAAACFGTLGPLSRFAYDAGLTPLGFATWRAGLGALVIVCLVAARTLRGRPLVGLGGLSRRARASLLVAVLSGIVLNLAVFIAFGRITIALALLGFYTYPAMVTVAITVRDRRRPDGFHLVALAMALIGMAVVVLGQVDPVAGVTFDLIGLGLALLAAVSQTVFVLISRRGYAALPTDEATLVVLGGGAVGYLLIALAAGDVAAVTAPFRNPDALPYLLLGGILGAGIPSLLFLTGIRWIGGVRTGILAMFEPVTGTLLAAIFLAEALRPIQIVGGALVLGAGVLLQRSPAPRPAAELPVAGHEPASPPTRLAELPEPETEPIPLV
jgi:drug/metabolite transporter (DMT)-like permease